MTWKYDSWTFQPQGRDQIELYIVRRDVETRVCEYSDGAGNWLGYAPFEKIEPARVLSRADRTLEEALAEVNAEIVQYFTPGEIIQSRMAEDERTMGISTRTESTGSADPMIVPSDRDIYPAAVMPATWLTPVTIRAGLALHPYELRVDDLEHAATCFASADSPFSWEILFRLQEMRNIARDEPDQVIYGTFNLTVRDIFPWDEELDLALSNVTEGPQTTVTQGLFWMLTDMKVLGSGRWPLPG